MEVEFSENSDTEPNREEIQEENDSVAGKIIDVSSSHRQVTSDDHMGIVTPRSDTSEWINKYFELVQKFRDGIITDGDLRTLPSGVRLSEEMIYIPSSKKYREYIEFTVRKSASILGERISGDPVKVVVDSRTQKEHSLKTYSLNTDGKNNNGSYDVEKNYENEIRCWIDQNKTENSPKLYMFQLQKRDNEKKKEIILMIHMECLENDTATIQYVMLTLMRKIVSDEPALHRPFSLYVFKLILCVVEDFHKTGWAHNDLGGENFLLKITSEGHAKVYILDFEYAEKHGNIENDKTDLNAHLRGMLTAHSDDNRIREHTDLVTQCASKLSKENISECIRFVDEKLQIEMQNGGYEDENTMVKRVMAITSKLHEHDEEDLQLPSPPKSPVTPQPENANAKVSMQLSNALIKIDLDSIVTSKT